jgi:ABC-type ATPase with predicted acetyltransferase domain
LKKSRKKVEMEKTLGNYAEELLKKIARSVRDEDRVLTGIALQSLNLAEAFDKEVSMFGQSSASKPDLQFQQDLLGLYGKYTQNKYDI